VNFSQLEDRARELGLEILAFTTQDRFLVANGVLEAFEAPSEDAWRRPEAVRQRLQALQLVHPLGMGRTFRVLVLGRGVAPALRGLADPFAARTAGRPSNS
jgi:SAM-dependent MidA family methyltransferase